MFGGLISNLVMSMTLVTMNSSYSLKTGEDLSATENSEIEHFTEQQNILLHAADFYCQDHPDKCVSETDTKVVIPLYEIYKYSSIKNAQTFNVAKIESIYVDSLTNQIVAKNNFKSDVEKNKFLKFYKNKISKNPVKTTSEADTYASSQIRFSPNLELKVKIEKEAMTSEDGFPISEYKHANHFRRDLPLTYTAYAKYANYNDKFIDKYKYNNYLVFQDSLGYKKYGLKYASGLF